MAEENRILRGVCSGLLVELGIAFTFLYSIAHDIDVQKRMKNNPFYRQRVEEQNQKIHDWRYFVR